ncbi:MAG: hypothetical protein HKN19_11455, partial [Halioglobus sp.]|nr:hypothetical protein [Halioglobus sp.]
LQEQQIWQQVITAHAAESGAVPLLRISSAAELAADARKRLLRWQVDPSTPQLQQLFRLESDCRVFLEWLERFNTRLGSANLCTAEDCLTALARLDDFCADRPVVLVECEELAPLELLCLQSQASEVQQLPAPPGDAQCHLHGFTDRRAELEGVARWAENLQVEQPGATVGIVLADTGADRVTLEYLLRREFACLGNDYGSLPVNFSTGISLSEAPVVRDACAALALGLPRVAVQDIPRLMRSRYLQMADANSPLAQLFKQRLLENGSEEIEIAELRNFAAGVTNEEGAQLVLGSKLLELYARRELRGPGLPSEWSERFGAALALWGWPGSAPLDTLEYQQVKLWYSTAESLGALDGITGPVDYGTALALLREACERQPSHPQTVDSPVQVLGPLEAVGLSFDHLWLLGMQASAWPAPPTPNPFIPVSLQASRDMPHATSAREWQFGSTLLDQYRRANREVHASYALETDGVAEHPSALLQDFLPADAAEIDSPSDNMWRRQRAKAERELIEDAQAPPPAKDELAAVRGGASLVERQSLCPFRAFAEHRLHASPLPESQVGLSPAERGTLVHEALQVLWQGLGSHDALLALDADAEAVLISNACDSALPRLPGYRRRALGQACLDLEAIRLRELLAEWLAVERERADFSIAALEEDVTVQLSRLTVRLRVDRIDTLADGSRVIIDYKTGRARVGDWLGERPARPQMLLYALAAGEPPAALAFGQVRPGDCGYRGIGTVPEFSGIQTDISKAVGDGAEAEDWSTLNAHWANTLESLVNEFLEGHAPVDPQGPEACRYCGLQPLCRIGLEADHA